MANNIVNSSVWPLPPFSAFIPSPPVIPTFYWDVYSQEQRIKTICEAVGKSQQYLDTISDAINDLHDSIEENNAELIAHVTKQLENTQNEIAIELNLLKAYVDNALADITASMYIWDVTTGKNENSKSSLRHLFFATTEYGMTITEFNKQNITVEELTNSGLNALGVAAIAYTLFYSSLFKADKYLYKEA